MQKGPKSERWGTPREIVEFGKIALIKKFDGPWDLDVASEEAFNANVKATRYLTADNNALVYHWANFGLRIFCNPPGKHYQSFWSKVLETVESNPDVYIFWVGFNITQLRVLHKNFSRGPIDFHTILLRERIKFLMPDGTQPPSPNSDNYITLIGNTGGVNWEVCDKWGISIKRE